ncbi:hypothetical protein EJ02DRAFT_353790 [Clathrospora elynae]|uniref:Uncharacterized protein n=1 Tax=Clathrospora elynae TaxID=706981 RepID=A0A6A5SHC1_9PLEO|nr:hypothetical protein EJ02DRAFT_353790 [Clathrospora elynae]
MAQKLILPSRFRLEASKRREDLVLQRRLEYLDSLTDQTAKDYKLMMILLSSAFSTSTANVGSAHDPWVFDWGGGIDGQRAFRQGKSWLAWFVLTEGPDLFWSQWWSLPPASAQNYIRDRATTAFKALPAALADHQRLLAQKFQDALHEKALHTDFDGSNPYPYSAHLRGGRPEQADHEPFRETMGHVPFLVNFRCPEELVKRTELLLEGRAASRTTQGLVSREA